MSIRAGCPSRRGGPTFPRRFPAAGPALRSGGRSEELLQLDLFLLLLLEQVVDGAQDARLRGAADGAALEGRVDRARRDGAAGARLARLFRFVFALDLRALRELDAAILALERLELVGR